MVFNKIKSNSYDSDVILFVSSTDKLQFNIAQTIFLSEKWVFKIEITISNKCGNL